MKDLLGSFGAVQRPRTDAPLANSAVAGEVPHSQNSVAAVSKPVIPLHTDPLDARPGVTPPPGVSLIHDAVLIFVDPKRVFINMPRVNRSGRFLMGLLVLLAGVGWLAASTGVHEYEIRDAATKAATTIHLKAQGMEDEAVQIETAGLIEKTAIFAALMNQILMTGGPPLQVLITVGTLGAVLFAAVALGGGKPKMGLLAGIVAFSSVVELPRQALYFALIHQTGKSRVETSLAALPTNWGGESGVDLGTYLLLRRLDPFDLWFWLLFALGVRFAARFSWKWTILATITLASVSVLASMSGDYLMFAEIKFEAPPS